MKYGHGSNVAICQRSTAIFFINTINFKFRMWKLEAFCVNAKQIYQLPQLLAIFHEIQGFYRLFMTIRQFGKLLRIWWRILTENGRERKSVQWFVFWIIVNLAEDSCFSLRRLEISWVTIFRNTKSLPLCWSYAIFLKSLVFLFGFALLSMEQCFKASKGVDNPWKTNSDKGKPWIFYGKALSLNINCIVTRKSRAPQLRSMRRDYPKGDIELLPPEYLNAYWILAKMPAATPQIKLHLHLKSRWKIKKMGSFRECGLHP